MDSLTPRTSEDSLQDRINRMNAWKESRRKADEEFIRKQRIRMFMADCDDIRPGLRNQLVRDSKNCQLHQIDDHRKRILESKDFDDAWHQVLIRDFHSKTEHERALSSQRRHEGLAVQDYLKQQMSEKIERDLEIHKEIDKEKELIAQEKKHLTEQEVERVRNEQKQRQALKEEILKQINYNHVLREMEHEQVLKIEQTNNEKARQEMLRDEAQRKADQEYFKREVYHYLDYLRKSRHQNEMEEHEKQKLIDDIRSKKVEDEWNKRCETRQQRLLVNENARRIQRLQLHEQEKLRIAQEEREKAENFKFNEREMSERIKLKEEKWQQRINAFRYGQTLLEQRKSEELRNAAMKQKLDEELKLAAIERERRERMGLEYLKSAEDLMPLHPNLIVINRGKKNN